MASRYFVEALPESGVQGLPNDVAHHLARVLRIRPGDDVLLFDGRGGECPARVVSVSGSRVEADVGPTRYVPPIPARHIEIAFALPKGARAEWLFEHATEVGAAVLRPLTTARSDPSDANRRIGRWQRITRAAAGQCGRSHLPVVTPVESLRELLRHDDLPESRYVGHPGGAPLSAPPTDRAILLVGPPGGLTEEELAQAVGSGFVPCGLGPLILRTETAALAGAVLLLGGQ